MTELLDQVYKDQLAIWIGKTCHLRLLYKISRDGCSAATFHQKCDGQGPTVTVLYNTNNTIYGGYLSQSWHSYSNFINDPNAFLFRLQYNGSSNPLKFPIDHNSYMYAGYGKSSYGPTFGDSDIRSFSGTINKSGKYFPLNGSLNMGNIYLLNGQNVNSITNGHLQVTDLEVYQVKDGSDPNKSTEVAVGSVILDYPWRKFPEFNEEAVQQLKKLIIDFEPESDANLSAVNILLIGQIGAGKSSFFNSVNSIFRGKITSKARSGSFEHSLTTVFRKYTIKDQNSGHNLKIRLCDTRGLEENFRMDAQEIAYILDGNVPDRYQFNPSSPFTTETFGFIRNPRLGDKIHCVAFVVDGSTIDVMPQKILKQLKELQGRMNQRNIPQVVYLTKLDKVCPKVDEDASNMFYSPAVRDTVNKVADVMGLPRGHILPIKNYENETSLDPNIDILILKALKQTADFADDYLEEQVDKMAAEGKRKEKD